MNEADYIKAANRVKVSAALTILRDVLPGDEWGISQSDLSEITSRLGDAEERLFASYQLCEQADWRPMATAPTNDGAWIVGREGGDIFIAVRSQGKWRDEEFERHPEVWMPQAEA